MAALNLAIVADDEPVAAPAVVRPVGKDKFDTRAICRAAVLHWPVLKHWLTTWKGQPSEEVLRLNPAYVSPMDLSVVRHGLPRLIEFQGLSNVEVDGSIGAWH